MNAHQRRKSYRRAKRLKRSKVLCLVTAGYYKGKVGRVEVAYKGWSDICDVRLEDYENIVIATKVTNIRPLTPREIAKHQARMGVPA